MWIQTEVTCPGCGNEIQECCDHYPLERRPMSALARALTWLAEHV